MRTLYIDCGMGAAGDMLAGALLDLIEDRTNFLQEINKLSIPGVEIIAETKSKCGINGIYFTVKVNDEIEGLIDQTNQHEQTEHGLLHSHDHVHDHDHNHSHHHEHRSMRDIEKIIAQFTLKQVIKDNIINVYRILAEAESKAHGVDVSEIHFHEVGSMDAIADITAVCMLIDELSVEKIIVSPIHVGSGHVHCAHGVLPVPAPATAYILQDIPIYGGDIKGELCTPTGAALLKYFADDFAPMPQLEIKQIGYGHGKKDFAQMNSVRVFLAETKDKKDAVCILSCNVDDMTAEEISFAMDLFFEEGALDVYTIPIGMKKSRPGILISLICKLPDKDKFVKMMFKHTSTIGIREAVCERHILERFVQTLTTPYGNVRQKISQGYGITKQKFEYEDLAEIARYNDLSLLDLIKDIEKHIN